MVKIVVRTSELFDIDEMVLLSKTKRKLYEKAQPQFWRYAGEEGDNTQRQWFQELLEDKNYVMLTASSLALSDTPCTLLDQEALMNDKDDGQKILGFIIGKIIPSPEVYDPGGLTVMIDDFCVKYENLWDSVGFELITTLKASSKAKGATQILVVCGAHDCPKRTFLMDQNLSIASEWYVGGIV